MTATPPAASAQRLSAQAYSEAHHRWVYLPTATVTVGGEGGGTLTYPAQLFAYDTISAPYIYLQETNPSYAGQFGRTLQGRLIAYVGSAKIIPVPGDLLNITAETAPAATGDIGMDALGRIRVYASGAAETVPTVTDIGGYTSWVLNKTGAASVKGTVVAPSSTTDFAVELAGIGVEDPVGVVYDAGVADGALMRIVTKGWADVLIEAADTIQRRYWLGSPTATPGRGHLAAAVPAAPTHFTELGHCFETKANGGNTLARCLLHFN